MSGVRSSIARVIVNAETSSLKRLAWAYGCAPRGSNEERQLEELLLARVRIMTTAVDEVAAEIIEGRKP